MDRPKLSALPRYTIQARPDFQALRCLPPVTMAVLGASYDASRLYKARTHSDRSLTVLPCSSPVLKVDALPNHGRGRRTIIKREPRQCTHCVGPKYPGPARSLLIDKQSSTKAGYTHDLPTTHGGQRRKIYQWVLDRADHVCYVGPSLRISRVLFNGLPKI